MTSPDALTHFDDAAEFALALETLAMPDLTAPADRAALSAAAPAAPPLWPRPAPSDPLTDFDTHLDQLEQLARLLADDAPYVIPPPAYALPAGFLLSIVVPVYNEQQTIRQIVARLLALPLPLEIIVVDDCSTDGTRQVLRELGQLRNVRLVFQPFNGGKGSALRKGFELARGDVVIVQDADLEYDPRDIPRLLAPIVQDRADVVYGSRFLHRRPAGSSLVHRWGNRLLTGLSNLTTGLRLTDMETCYKALRRGVLRDMPLRQDRFGFEPEITAKIARRGLRVVELPIGYQPRGWHEGKKIGLRDLWNAVYCIARYALRD